jgi:hypothetical protein
MTRRHHGSDEQGPAIELTEWLAIVEQDPELRLDGYADAPLPNGDVFRAIDPSFAVWLAYSKHQHSKHQHSKYQSRGNQAWIHHWEGNVIVKNPDQEIRCKLWQLAQPLSARVQGDEDEFYGPDGKELG